VRKAVKAVIAVSLILGGAFLGAALLLEPTGEGLQRIPVRSSEIRAADLDGDGRMDIVCGRSQVLLNTGAGFKKMDVEGMKWEQNSWVDDFDGDGRAEIALERALNATSSRYELVLWHYAGGENFETSVFATYKDSRWNYVMADLNGDGAREFVDWYDVMERSHLPVYFPPELVSDLDGDGDDDAVGNDRYERSLGLVLLENTGGGRMRKAGALRGDFFSVLGCDLDSDGRTDLVSAMLSDHKVRVHFNRGGWNFSASDCPAEYPIAIATGDLDSDGDGDIVVGAGDWIDQDHLQLLINDGAGGFAPKGELYVAGDVPRGTESILFLDADGDGDRDLLCVASDGPSTILAVLPNRGRGDFADFWLPVAVDVLGLLAFYTVLAVPLLAAFDLLARRQSAAIGPAVPSDSPAGLTPAPPELPELPPETEVSLDTPVPDLEEEGRIRDRGERRSMLWRYSVVGAVTVLLLVPPLLWDFEGPPEGNEGEDIRTLRGNVVWKDLVKDIEGDFRIEKGATLSIQNCTLRMNCWIECKGTLEVSDSSISDQGDLEYYYDERSALANDTVVSLNLSLKDCSRAELSFRFRQSGSKDGRMSLRSADGRTLWNATGPTSGWTDVSVDLGAFCGGRAELKLVHSGRDDTWYGAGNFSVRTDLWEASQDELRVSRAIDTTGSYSDDEPFPLVLRLVGGRLQVANCTVNVSSTGSGLHAESSTAMFSNGPIAGLDMTLVESRLGCSGTDIRNVRFDARLSNLTFDGCRLKNAWIDCLGGSLELVTSSVNRTTVELEATEAARIDGCAFAEQNSIKASGSALTVSGNTFEEAGDLFRLDNVTGAITGNVVGHSRRCFLIFPPAGPRCRLYDSLDIRGNTIRSEVESEPVFDIVSALPVEDAGLLLERNTVESDFLFRRCVMVNSTTVGTENDTVRCWPDARTVWLRGPVAGGEAAREDLGFESLRDLDWEGYYSSSGDRTLELLPLEMLKSTEGSLQRYTLEGTTVRLRAAYHGLGYAESPLDRFGDVRDEMHVNFTLLPVCDLECSRFYINGLEGGRLHFYIKAESIGMEANYTVSVALDGRVVYVNNSGLRSGSSYYIDLEPALLAGGGNLTARVMPDSIGDPDPENNDRSIDLAWFEGDRELSGNLTVGGCWLLGESSTLRLEGATVNFTGGLGAVIGLNGSGLEVRGSVIKGADIRIINCSYARFEESALKTGSLVITAGNVTMDRLSDCGIYGEGDPAGHYNHWSIVAERVMLSNLTLPRASVWLDADLTRIDNCTFSGPDRTGSNSDYSYLSTLYLRSQELELLDSSVADLRVFLMYDSGSYLSGCEFSRVGLYQYSGYGKLEGTPVEVFEGNRFSSGFEVSLYCDLDLSEVLRQNVFEGAGNVTSLKTIGLLFNRTWLEGLAGNLTTATMRLNWTDLDGDRSGQVYQGTNLTDLHLDIYPVFEKWNVSAGHRTIASITYRLTVIPATGVPAERSGAFDVRKALTWEERIG